MKKPTKPKVKKDVQTVFLKVALLVKQKITQQQNGKSLRIYIHQENKTFKIFVWKYAVEQRIVKMFSRSLWMFIKQNIYILCLMKNKN